MRSVANAPYLDEGGTDGRALPVLVDGLVDYLAAVRRPAEAASSLESARLVADRDAWKIAYPRPPGMVVSNSYVVDAGLETPVRLYRPECLGAQAAILYLHGGGFTTGSIESYDGLATAMAEATGACVISVHYGRMPESTPGAILAQCHAVLRWARRMAEPLGIDPACIALAGDSAGAFLATHLAMRVRDEDDGPAPVCQLLCYGVYDLDTTRVAYSMARDPALGRSVIDAMIATYRACEARDGVATPAPLRVVDLSGLPPAILLGAEHDPMATEGREYAAALRAAGVPVESRVAAGMCHGFLRAVRFSAPVRAEMRWLADAFQSRLRQQG